MSGIRGALLYVGSPLGFRVDRFAGRSVSALVSSARAFAVAPDYEVSFRFSKGDIYPLHTTYWVASASAVFDPTLIVGCHQIVEDGGVKVLKVHSEKMYQVGLGDGVIGYGPPEATGNPEWDISDRVCGKPRYYFDYIPGIKMGIPPLIPAYWQFELDAMVKPLNPSKLLNFVVENWIYLGYDQLQQTANKTVTTMVWYRGSEKRLYYGYGNYPNNPTPKVIAEGYEPPEDYFRIHYLTNFALKTAQIEWGGFTATLPLSIELDRGPYYPEMKLFNCFQCTMLEPGDLLIKSLSLKFWNKV